MAAPKYETLLVLIFAFMLCREATAQSSCSSTIMSLSSCLNYVTGNISTPSASCCSSLAGVVQSQPRCLCPLLTGGGSSLGIAINQTLALALPAVCNVQTPPVSQCNAVANGPAAVPAPSPLSSPTDASTEPADTPATTTVPESTGSKTVPSTNGGTSDGSSITSSIQLTAFALFITAWAANTVKF
ncbi:hypothetical protein Salat_0500400 [Sesamum alatum]|uniref:Bifunctional inhibitor/plant lipid transfer protein/seed storage helical domain-containing protein n=1 Tax=Sesamum alatum TaxID=300844 RepID=A0AAE1Z3S6_9LAMI|nr:hypothetical protein Salat_0500400 [Sesamum alatum]